MRHEFQSQDQKDIKCCLCPILRVHMLPDKNNTDKNGNDVSHLEVNFKVLHCRNLTTMGGIVKFCDL